MSKELKLASESELLKQQLVTRYDFSPEKLLRELDDCNMKFIDTAAIKRFMNKCRVYPADDLLISVIRRLDLDSDGRLSKSEFKDAIIPIENFTKGSLVQFQKTLESQKVKRVKPAKVTEPKPSKISNILHGKDTPNEREHLMHNTVYAQAYDIVKN